MAIGFPVKANYVTGEVLTATNMNDLSGSVNLLTSAQYAAGKNKIINGDYYFNQRNFTSTTTTGTYMFDRWITAIGGDGTSTYTPQTFTPGTAPVSGYEGKSYQRIVTTGQTNASVATITYQPIEDVRTYAGQTVTYSFWAKASSGTPKIALSYNQNFGSGGSADVAAYISQVTLSTSWARYSVSFAVPSISGKTIGSTTGWLGILLWVSAGSSSNSITNSLGIQTNTFELWGHQLEAGSTATAFQTATGTIQGELAACQRYYWRNTSGVAYGLLAGAGAIYSATAAQISIQFPVPMRVAPTGIDFSSIMVQDSASNNFTPSSATIDSVTSNIYGAGLTCVISAATANRPARLLANNSTTAYIGASAEL
jgi:hypothetical protein